MKALKKISTGILLVSTLGCGVDPSDAPHSDGIRRVPLGSRGPSVDGNQVVLPVLGVASFGSQCPHGYIAPPQPSAIEFVSYPSSLIQLELSESLSPLLIQADCKKNTIDIRGVSRTSLATTWEFPPSGQIDFSVDGGHVKIKDDGAGNQDCSTPALIEVRGKVDCTHVDYPEIRVYVFWNLGKNMHDLNPSMRPQPGASPFPEPSASPSSRLSSVPALTPAPFPPTPPSVAPSGGPEMTPTPTASPFIHGSESTPSIAPSQLPSPLASQPPTPSNTAHFPFNFHFNFPFFGRSHLGTEEPTRESPKCKFPEDSYLQTPEKIVIRQCVN